MKKILLTVLVLGFIAGVPYGLTTSGVVASVKNAAQTAANAAKRFAVAAKNSVTRVATSVSHSLSSAKQYLGTKLTSAKESLSSIHLPTLPTKASLTASLEKFKTSASALKTKIGSGLTSAGATIKSGLSKTKTALGSGLSKIKSGLIAAKESEVGQAIGSGVKSLGSAAFEIAAPIIVQGASQALSNAVTNATLGFTQAVQQGTSTALQAVGLNPNDPNAVATPAQQEAIAEHVEEHMDNVEDSFTKALIDDAKVNPKLAAMLAKSAVAGELKVDDTNNEVLKFINTFNALTSLYLPEGSDKFADLLPDDQEHLLAMAQIFLGAIATKGLSGSDIISMMQDIIGIQTTALTKGKTVASIGLVDEANKALAVGLATEGGPATPADDTAAAEQSQETLSDESLAELGAQ